ncbi:MAG: S24/S26 family peptidase [Planctomycetota bacterium]
MNDLRLDVFGFCIRVRCGNDPRVTAALREYVAAFECAGDNNPAAAGPLAEPDDETLAGIAAHPPNALHLLGALLAPRFVLVHASAVQVGGEVVAFAGRTGNGKTTAAVIAAADHGVTLLGDDLLLIEWSAGLAAALPTGLHVRPWTAALAPLPPAPQLAPLQPLRRLIVLAANDTPLTDALLRCTFGVTPATLPDHLRRLLSAVSRCDLRRVPPLQFRADDPAAASRVAQTVRGWLADGDVTLLGAPSSSQPALAGICTGISMLPALRPGDRVTIRPQATAPRRHDVVVFRDPALGLVMHRVLAVSADGTRITSRGDNAPGGGEQWPLAQLLGVVENVPSRPPSRLWRLRVQLIRLARALYRRTRKSPRHA